MKTINDRIKYLVDIETSGNKRAFAKRICVSASAVENIIGKRKSKPSCDFLVALSAIKGININWVLLGNGNVFNEENTEKDEIKSLKEILFEVKKAIHHLETVETLLKEAVNY